MVAAVDRIGRTWIDTVGALRDLRDRKVRVRSLAETELVWTRFLDSDPDSPEALVGDILASAFTWMAHQERVNIGRRTRAGLARARAQGKHIGRPRRMTPVMVDAAVRLRKEGMSYTAIAEALNVGYGTVRRALNAPVQLEIPPTE